MEVIGGAQSGKAIIILNPAEPPLVMRDTIYCSLPAGSDEAKVGRSRSRTMVDEVQTYVPGYRLRGEPQFDRLEDGTGRVAIFIEVEGAGDYLPPYSGNLDIMTAAATKVGDEIGAGAARRRDRNRGWIMTYSDQLDIRVTDTSLRDGSHAKRHQFTEEHIRAIVAALDDAGMPVIEVTHGDGLGGSSLQLRLLARPTSGS